MGIGDFVEQKKTLFNQGLYSQSSEAKEMLGTLRELEDGRVFVYARAGATNLAAGKLTQSPVQVANHLNISVAAAASVGSRRVYVTLGATAADANAYKDGYLYVNSGDGAGLAYKIRGHAAISASSSGYIELYDSIRKALTTSSKCTLVKNPFNGTIVHPSPPTAPLVGIPPIDVAANYYYWSQVKGLAVCLIDGTPAIGDNVVPSDSVDGAVEAAVNTDVRQRVGTVVNTGVDAEYKMIMLALPGF